MRSPDHDRSTEATEALGKLMTGYEVDDLMPALCWLLGEVGAQFTDDKKMFLMLVARAVNSAYELNSTKGADHDTQIH